KGTTDAATTDPPAADGRPPRARDAAGPRQSRTQQEDSPRMDRLANTVRPYAWGSPTAIPELLGTDPTGQPQAELWMGAHPGAPSRIDRGSGLLALNDVIDADPTGELGAGAVERFGPR